MFDFKYNDCLYPCDIGTMTPLQYDRMINIMEHMKPKRICEFGTGISTMLFKSYCSNNGSALYSIEHDSEYVKDDTTILMGLIENSDLSIGNKVYHNCVRYDGLEHWLDGQEKFDFVLIDGPNDGIPFNSQNLEYARIQLFDFVLMDKMNMKSTIMYHDSEREVSQRTLKEFETLLREKNFMYSKEIVIETDSNVIDYNKRVLGVCPELTIYEIIAQKDKKWK